MNATDFDNFGRETEAPVSAAVLAGIVAGGGVLVLVVLTTSALIATLACHRRWYARKNKLHISNPMRAFSIQNNNHSPSLTPKQTDKQFFQELHGTLQDRSYKTSFKLKDITEPTTSTPQRTHDKCEEKETALDGGLEDKSKVSLPHLPSQPKPISHLSPVHASEKKYSLSMSKRPRLPTPNTSKGANSNSSTPTAVSPTPISQVRTSQWYDNVRQMLHPLMHYRHSDRFIEFSGHYVNDGLVPPRITADNLAQKQLPLNK